MYYSTAVITIDFNCKLTDSCLRSWPGFHTQLFLLLQKTLIYAQTPQFIFVTELKFAVEHVSVQPDQTLCQDVRGIEYGKEGLYYTCFTIFVKIHCFG
jgi:hypothetical protein